MPEPKVLPTLFVGLGSTGAKIVSRIKRQLDPTVDDISRQFYRYLRIHSETTPEPGVDEDVPSFVMSTRELDGKTAVGVFQGNQDAQIAADFHKWWPRDLGDNTKAWVPPLTKLDKGAGGVRPIGRLLLHYSCSRQGSGLLATMRDIRQSITNAFNNLDPEKKQRVAGGGDAAIECYLFGLLAGGTCSGSLLDVAYLIRQGLGPINLYGAFALGDICYYDIPARERDQVKVSIQKKNTIFALAELNLVQCAAGRDLVRDHWISRVGSEELSPNVLGKYPFERVVLVGADNDAGYTLGSFESYQDFLADYYVQLHTSQATTQQMNRDVDEENQQLVELDTMYPARFNQSSRIGMLSLSVPTKKILAAATSKVAISLAANSFKNADDSRWESAQNEFIRQVMWHETNSLLAPTAEDLTVETFRPLPDKKDELRALYEQRLEDIKGRYERWKQGADPELQAKHAEFIQRWRGATQDLIHDFLGRNEGAEVSLGGLKAVVKSLLDHVGKRIDDLNRAALELQSQLQRSGDTNPERTLRRELDAVVADFPESSLSPIAAFRRRGWSEDENLIGLLQSYRNAIRENSIATATITALKLVRSELEAVELARCLVARRAGEVLTACQSAADDEFDTSKSKARSPRVEILKGRNEVETYFVDPILEGPEPSAEPGAGGARPSKLKVLCTAIMGNWRSEEGLPLYDAFTKLAAAVQQSAVRNEQEALQNAKLKTSARSLQRQFEDQLSAAIERYVRPAVEAVSIWQALAEYAEKQGGDVSQTLLDYFGGLQTSVGFFTKLSPDAGREQGPGATRSYYVCDTVEAEGAFRSLGIKNPDSFLEKLLTKALGYAPTAMAGAKARRSEIHILLNRRGDVPLFFDAFYKDLRNVLRKDGAQDPKFEKYWADRRMPEWIAAWHASPARPLVPED